MILFVVVSVVDTHSKFLQVLAQVFIEKMSKLLKYNYTSRSFAI